MLSACRPPGSAALSSFIDGSGPDDGTIRIAGLPPRRPSHRRTGRRERSTAEHGPTAVTAVTVILVVGNGAFHCLSESLRGKQHNDARNTMADDDSVRDSSASLPDENATD